MDTYVLTCALHTATHRTLWVLQTDDLLSSAQSPPRAILSKTVLIALVAHTLVGAESLMLISVEAVAIAAVR